MSTISVESVIKPKTPKSPAWECLGASEIIRSMGFPSGLFYHRLAGLTVISAVEVAVDSDGSSNGPEYHVSISKNGKRCSSAEARMVLTVFDMEGAEEDNHVPHGKVRNFWKPVNETLIGIECECKSSENAIVEDGGDYVWRT